MPSIELKNLKVTYYNNNEETLALDDVNVSFINEKSYAIIGPSGCGKTTLIRTICGLLDYEGMILSNGVDYSTVDFKNRNISYVDETITLNPNIDVYNNIASPLIFNKFKRSDIDKRIKTISHDLGIERCLSLFPPQLSIGETQLVSLAKAIVKQPDLLLLDEPFSNLDLDNKKKLILAIKKLRQERPFTMVFVTHYYDEVYELADSVVIMENGKINKIIDRNDKTFNYLKEIMENNSGD